MKLFTWTLGEDWAQGLIVAMANSVEAARGIVRHEVESSDEPEDYADVLEAIRSEPAEEGSGCVWTFGGG